MKDISTLEQEFLVRFMYSALSYVSRQSPVSFMEGFSFPLLDFLSKLMAFVE